MADTDIVVLHSAPVYAPTVQPMPQHQRYGFPHVTVRRCSILQIVCGLVAIVTTVTLKDIFWYNFIAVVVFIVSGILGIVASKTKGTKCILGCLVMSVLSICVVCVLILSIFEGATDFSVENVWIILVHAFNVPVAITVVVVSFIQCVVCGRAVCCPVTHQPQADVIYTVAKDETMAISVKPAPSPKPIIRPTYNDGVYLTQRVDSLGQSGVSNQNIVKNMSPQLQHSSLPSTPRPKPSKKMASGIPPPPSFTSTLEDDQPLIAGTGREQLYPQMPQ